MIKILNVESLYSALYKTLDFCIDKNETIEIVVPDKLSLFMEKFLFQHMNKSSSFNIKVSTFNRFAKKTCSVDKSQQISKIGSILLIHKILNENFDKFKIFQNKAYSFTYAEDIFRTIGQLKASKIDWKEMKNFSSIDSRLEDKIKDLAIVYEEYENQKAGLLDPSDLFLMSTLTVANGKEGREILFVGFDDFTAIEYSIIERLSLVANVNIFNYASKNENKFLYNQEVISQLKNIAYINQIPFMMEQFKVDHGGVKEFLERNLFALNSNCYTLNKELIKVYAGSNFVDEIEFVARDIKKKVLSGERFDNFGVAVFGLEDKINKFKEIFSKYEINYYLDNEISINKSVLYKFFVSVLKYNLDGYSLCNLIDIINSPFFDVERENKNKIINKLLDVNFRGKIDDRLALDLDEEIKASLINFVSKLTFEKSISATDLINNFNALEDEINFDEILENLANQEISNQILLRRSKSVLFSLFDEIIRFNADIDIHAFYDILTHAANILKINNLPLSIDSVKIVDANNSMEIFNELYIVGVTHENAPNLKYDCGIILDTEIDKLNFSNKLNPTISHINRLSKLRLFNTSLLFENELTLTYSSSQSELVKECLNRIQVETRKRKINIVPITKFDYDKYVVLSKWDLVEFVSKNKIENYKNCEKIIKNKNFNNLNKENLNIFNDFDNISATTLENYFKCPMMAFLSNILKIKPRMETEILAFDIGNVLHEIMFKYYKTNKQVVDIYEFCKNEVFKFVERNERLKLNINSPVLLNLIDEAMRVVNAVDYIDANSDFVPKFFEFDFKNDKALKLKNISIVGKVDRVDVFNNMFRIVDYKSGKADASLKELYYGNKLQLFLYSCAMENILKNRMVGTFYLPLHNTYTKELSNTYSMKGFYLAEDFVVKAFDKRLECGGKSDIVNAKLNKSGGVTKMGGYKELDINELNRLKTYSKVVSEKAVEEIKSGYISPIPSEVSKPCEYCPYVQICLKNSNNVQYRKANKINLDSFKEVQDESV